MTRKNLLFGYTLAAFTLLGASAGSLAQKVYDIRNAPPEISCYVQTGDRFGASTFKYKGRKCIDMERKGESVQYGDNSSFANDYSVERAHAAQRAERERLEEQCTLLPQPEECYNKGLGLGQH